MIALSIPASTPRAYTKQAVRCETPAHKGERQAPLACADVETEFGRMRVCATCLMQHGTQGVHMVFVQEGMNITYLSTNEQRELFLAKTGRIV